MQSASVDYAHIASVLEQSQDYRVLRRLVPRTAFADSGGEAEKIGILFDVETTGLDHTKEEIIELGMVKFSYLPDGRVCRVIDTFESFNEPSFAIPEEIIEMTGITDEMVAGHRFDDEAVRAFVANAVVVIAHSASFDRRFAERYWSMFERKHWACSATEVDWRSCGFEGSRLSYLLAGVGLFHKAHRAIDDCHALLEVLASETPKQQRPALSLLLEKARRRTSRIWAVESPFDLKDLLKKRRYRWNDGTDGRPKAWYVDVDETGQEAEIEFLKKTIYQREVELPVDTITSLVRFSARV